MTTVITSTQGFALSQFISLESESCTTYDPSLYSFAATITSYVDGTLYGTPLVIAATDACGERGIQMDISAAESALIPVGILKLRVTQTPTGGDAEVCFNADFVQGA